jgi:uncharacterized protein YndB with AHSA1/START domain
MGSHSGRTDHAGLLIHRDRDVVFSALIDEDALVIWLPPTGMTGRFDRFDMRQGGSYRLVLTYLDAPDAGGKTTSDQDVSEVRITRLVPDQVLEQEVDFESEDPSFQGTMTMLWSVESTPDGTIVQLTAHNVPVGVHAGDHAEGLMSSLVNLARYLEP